MASFFELCLWNRTFLSDLSRSTDANRSTFGCRFQSSSFLFHCSFPFFFFFANSISLVFLLFWMRILCTEELVSAKARRKTPSAKRASTSKTDGKAQRSTGRSTGRSSVRSIDVSWQSEVMTPTGSKQRPRLATPRKESTTRTRPRQRAPPFCY